VILLKERDAGRAALVVAPDGASPVPAASALAPAGSWLIDQVSCDNALRAVIERLLVNAVLVDEVQLAAQLSQVHPSLVFVTQAGDVFTRDVVHGGSQSAPSLLEVQAAFDETQAALQQVVHAAERARFDMVAARQAQLDAATVVEHALSGLHESDARMAAVAEQLGQLGQVARAAGAEAERLTQSLAAAEVAHATDVETHQLLQQRLATAQAEPAADLGADEREELAELARVARQQEVDARLSLRTGEERVTAVGIRAEQLERAASSERDARVAAIARR
jgi:chromosome segregation protein